MSHIKLSCKSVRKNYIMTKNHPAIFSIYIISRALSIKHYLYKEKKILWKNSQMRLQKNLEYSSDIIQLIYVSHISNYANSKFDKNLHSIINYSRVNNFLHGITSALMTDGKVYAQIIEGPTSSVENLYAKVIRDDRHYNVIKLQQSVTHIRLLRQRSMAFIELTNVDTLHSLSNQSTPKDLRTAYLLILKSLRPILIE